MHYLHLKPERNILFHVVLFACGAFCMWCFLHVVLFACRAFCILLLCVIYELFLFACNNKPYHYRYVFLIIHFAIKMEICLKKKLENTPLVIFIIDERDKNTICLM